MAPLSKPTEIWLHFFLSLVCYCKTLSPLYVTIFQKRYPFMPVSSTLLDFVRKIIPKCHITLIFILFYSSFAFFPTKLCYPLSPRLPQLRSMGADRRSSTHCRAMLLHYCVTSNATAPLLLPSVSPCLASSIGCCAASVGRQRRRVSQATEARESWPRSSPTRSEPTVTLLGLTSMKVSTPEVE